MISIDYATLEELMLAHYSCADTQGTIEVSPKTFGEVFGTESPLIIIDDYIDTHTDIMETPKKRVPFYQTLHKHPKFVRK